MHMEAILDVNWLAVVIGAVLSLLLGSVWYAQSFLGKKWASGIGTAAVPGRPLLPILLPQLVANLFFAWSLGVALNVSLMAAVLVAATLATTIKANGFFVGKSLAAIAIEGGYIIVQAALIIVVLHLFA
jgi:hypothetical protein